MRQYFRYYLSLISAIFLTLYYSVITRVCLYNQSPFILDACTHTHAHVLARAKTVAEGKPHD